MESLFFFDVFPYVFHGNLRAPPWLPPLQKIAGLIRGLLRDNDGLHNPLIRPYFWKFPYVFSRKKGIRQTKSCVEPYVCSPPTKNRGDNLPHPMSTCAIFFHLFIPSRSPTNRDPQKHGDVWQELHQKNGVTYKRQKNPIENHVPGTLW